MATVNCISAMMIYYKACLLMAGVKAKDDLLKLMEATIKEILKIMLLTGMASMWERKDSGMRDSGKIMCLMEMAKLLTPMGQGTSVNS